VRAIAFVILLAGESAAFAASGNGTAKTTTLSALGVLNQAPLDFGNIIPNAGGTVTVNAQTGAATRVGVISAGGGTVSAAQFLVAATPGRVVSFSLTPNNNLVLNRIGGGASMTVQQFRVSFEGGAPSPIGPNRTVPANGALTLQIGGRLTVGAAQMEGVYEGNFILNVEYQ
jgi:Domain of unknown function (DUF4402)